MLWVICYDISDDKRRRRLVKLLKSYGVRVQASVFHCQLSTERILEVFSLRVKGLIDWHEDSCHMYPLQEFNKERMRQFGSCREVVNERSVIC